MSNFAFDFDGVICDVHHIFRGHYWDMFGTIIAKEDQQTDFSFTITESEYFEDWWWDEIPVAIARYQHICPPYAGALECLKSFYKDYGEPIHIITARETSNAVMQVTRLWCEQAFDFDYEITFTPTSEAKTDILVEADVAYFIDDRFKTAQALADVVDTSYLLNRKWNERETPLKDNVERVNSLWEMKKSLDEKLLA